MSSDYSYDEQGQFFPFFILTLTGIVTVPLTYTPSPEPRPRCACATDQDQLQVRACGYCRVAQVSTEA
ncbi:secretory subunit [Fusarium oxysporum]|nr:secretory subunit [Fusarium oxysporum]